MIVKLSGQKWKPLSELGNEMAKEISPLPKPDVKPTSVIKHFKDKKMLAIAGGAALLGGSALAYMKNKKK